MVRGIWFLLGTNRKSHRESNCAIIVAVKVLKACRKNHMLLLNISRNHIWGVQMRHQIWNWVTLKSQSPGHSDFENMDGGDGRAGLSAVTGVFFLILRCLIIARGTFLLNEMVASLGQRECPTKNGADWSNTWTRQILRPYPADTQEGKARNAPRQVLSGFNGYSMLYWTTTCNMRIAQIPLHPTHIKMQKQCLLNANFDRIYS